MRDGHPVLEASQTEIGGRVSSRWLQVDDALLSIDHCLKEVL